MGDIKIYTADEMPQGGDLWFKTRCGSLGASSVAAACSGGQGKTRKTLACQLIAESFTGKKTSIFQNDAMKWGIETEPQARDYFEFVNGVNVKEVGLITNSDYPGCHASPDGIFKNTGVEIKCPQPPNFIKYLLEERLPLEYKYQIFFTMMILELDHYWFVSFHPAFPRQLTLKVDRDEKFISTMKEKLAIFFSEMEALREKVVGQSKVIVPPKKTSKLTISI